MKKFSILMLMLIFIFIGCSKNDVNDESNQQPENSCIYNDMYWGTDREDILAERGEPYSNYPNSTLEYTEKFMGEDCEVSYVFDENNKLKTILVSGDTRRTYEDIKDLFIQTNGEPLKEEVAVDDSFVANWEVGNTVIQLVVNEEYDNYIVTYYLKTE